MVPGFRNSTDAAWVQGATIVPSASNTPQKNFNIDRPSPDNSPHILASDLPHNGVYTAYSPTIVGASPDEVFY
ncbi:hypothetical protein D3C84_839890 [compost metagenome]